MFPRPSRKGKNEYIQRDFLEGYIIENNDDYWVVDMFALVLYGTLVFPQLPRYVDAANPVLAIVAKII